MKWLYALLADAANESGGKTNALGIGVRMVTPARLPSIVPIVFIASAEVDADEVGSHPFKLTLERPDRKKTVLLDDKVESTARPPDEEGLPVEVRFQVMFPLLAHVEGIHVLRAQIGKARIAYPYLVKVTEPGEVTEGS